MRSVSVAERRARLGRRHRLAAGERAPDALAAARSIVCLHGTEQATIYLAARARSERLSVADLDRALYEQRTLVKHLAMRRTLFVFPRETLPIAQAAVSDRVAQAERRRLVRDVEGAGLHRDGARWLARAERAVLELLDDGREASSTELRAELPLLEGSISYGEGRSWGGRVPIGPRVLTVLSAAGRIVRATNEGRWTVSRPRWTSMRAWLGAELAPPPAPEGLARLVEAWLRAFGPGSEADIRWWLGSTLGSVRAALAELGAVEVTLDGEPGWLLPDDLEPEPPVEPWAALLPALDPATMGWSERRWYLGPHRERIFDSSGNGGPTAWWDGRIVGGWRQDPEGAIELALLEDVGAEARAALAREAELLGDWLGGTVAAMRYPAPLWERRE